MPRAPAAALAVTEEERRELLRFSASRSIPQSAALRARIVLGAADGVGNKVLARELATSLPTVLLWRGRYQSEGLLGILEERPRSGRPREVAPEQEAALIEMTLRTTPKNATHWSVRLMAREQGVSRFCHSGRACRNGRRTITSGTARPRCLPRWTLLPAR
jgi:transposase